MLNWLFLKRVENLHGQHEDDNEKVHYVRSTWIPAPGVILPFFLLVLSIVGYGVFLGFGVYFLGGSIGSTFLGAVVLLGVNATIRSCLKYRERVALQAEWDQPVGREVAWVRALSICIGILLAGAAGYILCLDPDLLAKFVTPLIPMVALAIMEGARNGVQIGGRWKEDQSFDIAEFQTTMKYPPATVERGDK
jgi:hypothetical protein